MVESWYSLCHEAGKPVERLSEMAKLSAICCFQEGKSINQPCRFFCWHIEFRVWLAAATTQRNVYICVLFLPYRYFLLCVNYFFYGETVTDYFFTLVQREEPLRILSKYHRFISFALYLTGTKTQSSWNSAVTSLWQQATRSTEVTEWWLTSCSPVCSNIVNIKCTLNKQTWDAVYSVIQFWSIRYSSNSISLISVNTYQGLISLSFI